VEWSARQTGLSCRYNPDRQGRWIAALLEHRHGNVTAVALANRMARIAWAVPTTSPTAWRRPWPDGSEPGDPPPLPPEGHSAHLGLRREIGSDGGKGYPAGAKTRSIHRLNQEVD